MKDFDTWNKKKNIIEQKSQSIHVQEREIWWCSLGINIGQEQDGKGNLYERPVLIFKKFNNNAVLVIPMSSKPKQGQYTYYSSEHCSTFILSQIRLISTKRLNRKKGKQISLDLFDLLKDRLISILKLKKPSGSAPKDFFTASSFIYDNCICIIHPDVSLSNIANLLLCQRLVRMLKYNP